MDYDELLKLADQRGDFAEFVELLSQQDLDIEQQNILYRKAYLAKVKCIKETSTFGYRSVKYIKSVAPRVLSRRNFLKLTPIAFYEICCIKYRALLVTERIL